MTARGDFLTANPELDSLLGQLIRQVKVFQGTLGGFFPFASIVAMDGKVCPVGVDTGTQKPGTEKEAVQLLEIVLRMSAQQGKCKAVGLCFDSRFRNPSGKHITDGIETFVEHLDGQSFRVVLPYRKSGSRDFQYGTFIISPAQKRYFSPSTGLKS